MKAAHIRRAILLFVGSALVASASGCAVGWRSFSMDSTSRAPFFGFELKERKTKSAAPVYNSISRTDSDNSRIEAAVRTDSPASRVLLKNRGKNSSNSMVTRAIDDDSITAAKVQRTENSQPSLSAPLPVSEAPRNLADRRSADAAIDFQ